VFPPIAVHIMPRIMGRRRYGPHPLRSHYNAAEALQIGMINKVVRDQDLEKETEAFLKPYLGSVRRFCGKRKKAIAAGLAR